jgi:ornithine cyclodeaminase/alanine dehydrogenase-like protein (mu-crystallin family)
MGTYRAHATNTIGIKANKLIGYNMAKNLQAKLQPSDTIRIYDINTESLNKFASEAKANAGGAAVQIVSNVHEAAENSVSPYSHL